MIELMSRTDELKLSLLIRQAHLKNVIFSTIGFFLDKGFKFQVTV